MSTSETRNILTSAVAYNVYSIPDEVTADGRSIPKFCDSKCNQVSRFVQTIIPNFSVAVFLGLLLFYDWRVGHCLLCGNVTEVVVFDNILCKITTPTLLVGYSGTRTRSYCGSIRSCMCNSEFYANIL